jgi:hypothetical protein
MQGTYILRLFFQNLFVDCPCPVVSPAAIIGERRRKLLVGVKVAAFFAVEGRGKGYFVLGLALNPEARG